MGRIAALIAASLLLAACQQTVRPENIAPAPEAVESGWRGLASVEDKARIGAVADAWQEALAQARRAGLRRQLAEEGRLLDPEAALPMPAPSPGSYMCRLIRFAPPARRARALTAFQPFFCHVGVDSNQLSITKQTGSDRPSGYLWEDGDRPHLIFLGSLATGRQASIPYGADPRRDMAGIFERIGPLKFRLVIPRPPNGSTLEVFELTPAPDQPAE